MEHNATYWNFIEQHHPQFYSDDRVLVSDILFRYISDDEVSPEDLVWIHKNFRTKEDVLTELKRIETQLFAEALDNYYQAMAV